jgi:general secretion pathway protein C
MLRSLAYSIACALTGAASGLLVVHLATPPAPTCPRAPVVELRQVATALAHTQYVAPRPPPPPASNPAPFILIDGVVACPTENRCVIKREFFADLLMNPVRLTGQARVMPSFRDGEPRGLKFYAVRPGTLPRAIGMKNGDLLTAINGRPLRTLDDALTEFTLLRGLRSLDLDIERKGEPVRLHVDIE